MCVHQTKVSDSEKITNSTPTRGPYLCLMVDIDTKWERGWRIFTRTFYPPETPATIKPIHRSEPI